LSFCCGSGRRFTAAVASVGNDVTTGERL
jgi:hypothetical protein